MDEQQLDHVIGLLQEQPVLTSVQLAALEATLTALNTTDFWRLSPEAQVHLQYLALLNRQADAAGVHYHAGRLRARTANLRDVAKAISSAPEYAEFDAPMPAVAAHRARMAWCAQLAPAQHILDIGGSSPRHEEGALFELGYPHRPRTHTIVDVPLAARYWGPSRFVEQPVTPFSWGTLYRYDCAAAGLPHQAGLQDKQFDLVFMGQTIEHISLSVLEQLLPWVRDHLSSTGELVFDTPNRTLTRLYSWDHFTDTDHQFEATPAEMQSLLERHGFTVTTRTAILPMPLSLAAGRFFYDEAACAAPTGANASEGFLFALHARKR